MRRESVTWIDGAAYRTQDFTSQGVGGHSALAKAACGLGCRNRGWQCGRRFRCLDEIEERVPALYERNDRLVRPYPCGPRGHLHWPAEMGADVLIGIQDALPPGGYPWMPSIPDP